MRSMPLALLPVGLLSIALLGVLAAARPQDDGPAASAPVWFEAVDVYVDSGDLPLAAYQFELSAAAGQFTIIGVEGGGHAAFADPPYYDPAALSRDRIILAAFSTDADLPTGWTHVARVHVMVTGPAVPDCELNLMVAATVDGTPIPASAALGGGTAE